MNKKLIFWIVLLSICIPLPVHRVSTTWVKSLKQRTNYRHPALAPADATATVIYKHKSLFSLKMDWAKAEAINVPYKVVSRVPTGTVMKENVDDTDDCDCNTLSSEAGSSMIIDKIRMPAPHKYIDYNGDGVLDLVRKEVDNKIYVYVNKGSNENPVYGAGLLYEKEIELQVPGPLKKPTQLTGWVHLTYDRFDVYIDEAYYNNNAPGVFEDFFNKFEPRYELMENITNWSSEEYYGKKLKINVTGYPETCYGGGGGHGRINLYFSDPLYMSGCEMAYRENGSWYFGNPGELGDNWRYMGVAIHEATHAINPEPILNRLWLTEGWARYDEYNILSNYYGNSYADINQETADYYIYQGDSGYNWEGYVANDYHDNTEYNFPIQESAGYDITAWMFTMLRNDYNLNWGEVYGLIDNNPETLNKAWELGGGGWYSYYTDTHIINLFGKASGKNFSEIKEIFRYDPLPNPENPPLYWGVRNWTDLDWYADLVPSLEVSDTIMTVGDSITLDATIYNNGAVGLNDVVVRFYSNTDLINEQVVSVADSSFTMVSSKYTAPEGTYTIKAVVNEDNIKIERDNSNNQDSVLVSFSSLQYGDANGDGGLSVSDVVYIINYLFKGGPAPVPVVQAGDANCDGQVSVADVVYLINYLFKGGPVPGC